MPDDSELVGRAADAMIRKMIETGSSFGSSREAIEILARAAIAEVQRWYPMDDQAKALGPIMLGWAGTSFEPDKGFWDSTTQAWGYLTSEMAFEPFHRPPTHWQPLLAAPQL